MKIVSSFIPPVASQPSQKASESAAQVTEQSLGPDSVESGGEASYLVVGEVETVLEQQSQKRREIIDLRTLQGDPLPLSNLRALSNYQSVASEPTDPEGGLARLDIIV